MKRVQLVLAAACALTSLGAVLEFEFNQRTPTDDALKLAADLAQLGKIERLQTVADSAPASPLGQVMTAGLNARRDARDPLAAMHEVEAAHRLGRLAPTLLAALLTLCSIVALIVGRKSLSSPAVALVVLGAALTAIAVITTTSASADLERAILTLGPLLTAAP